MHTKQFDYRNGLQLPKLADEIVAFFAETEDPEPVVSLLLPNNQDTKLYLDKMASREGILEALEHVFAQEPDELPQPAEHIAAEEETVTMVNTEVPVDSLAPVDEQVSAEQVDSATDVAD